jgi:hypothetical protein
MASFGKTAEDDGLTLFTLVRMTIEMPRIPYDLTSLAEIWPISKGAWGEEDIKRGDW